MTTERPTRLLVSALSLLTASSLAFSFVPTALGDFSASAETEAALADAQSRYYEALAQIDYLNDQYYEAQAEYNGILDQIYWTEQKIAELQASIEQKQLELLAAQDVLAERIASNYTTGNAGMLDVLLQSANFDDFVSRLYYANKIAESDAQAIQAVKDIKASLEADQQALFEQQAQLETLRAEQEIVLAQLEERVYAAQSYAESLDYEVQALIAQRDAEIAAAAEAARIAAEEEAARQQESAGQSGAGGGDVPDYSGSGSGIHDSSVVSAAYALIGTPYSVLDCSGLTSAAYAACGYDLYHQSGVQYNRVVSRGNLVGADGLVAGDLVFYARGGRIYHVGIYIGDGYIIDSIPSGGVQVRTLYFCDGFCGGGSPL